MNYIALKNGMLFGTTQDWKYNGSILNGNPRVVSAGKNEDYYLDGEIMLTAGTGWTPVKDFSCFFFDVQATWKAI